MSKVLLLVKGFKSGSKYGMVIKFVLTLVLVVIIAIGIISALYSENVNRSLADNLIRLHVIANSDSADDQALKIDIRDTVISYMETQLKNSKDIEQTEYIINTNMDRIKELASDEINSKGKNYPVNVMLGSYPFPTKAYGDITLPAGYYQALRVVIGKGEGANWWCVLFPPLCFVDATHGVIPDSVKQNLKKNLTKEEYGIISTAGSDEDIPVKIKFKIVELFQNSKVKFSGMVSKLFK